MYPYKWRPPPPPPPRVPDPPRLSNLPRFPEAPRPHERLRRFPDPPRRLPKAPRPRSMHPWTAARYSPYQRPPAPLPPPPPPPPPRAPVPSVPSYSKPPPLLSLPLSLPPSVEKTSIPSWETLTREIIDFSTRSTQTADVLRVKEELRQRLQDIIQTSFPDATLFMTGSSVSGFCDAKSDVDFCLLTGTTHNHKFKIRTLRAFGALLRQSTTKGTDNFSHVVVIPAAVPILHLTYRDICSDVSIDNVYCLKNSHLMRAFCKVDARVAPLVITIKSWSKCVGVNNAGRGYLSSYSIVLMTIFYLQNCRPPVLPRLKRKYQDTTNLNSLDHLQPHLFQEALDDLPLNNKDDCGRLLLAFFAFYNQFNFNSVISVRLGRSYKKPSEVGWVRDICIEEPFKADNTTRSLKSSNMREIRSHFARAFRVLESERTIRDLV